MPDVDGRFLILPAQKSQWENACKIAGNNIRADLGVADPDFQRAQVPRRALGAVPIVYRAVLIVYCARIVAQGRKKDTH